MEASSASGIDPEVVRDRLKASNIPLPAGTLTRALMDGNGFSDFKTYVNSGQLATDHSSGIGLNLYGNASKKSDALMLVAKMHAVGGVSSYYVTGNQLFRIVNNATDELAAIRRVSSLFIDWFERDFGSDERPYTLRDIICVEDFLGSRRDSGHTTHFGSHGLWNRLKWYSKDFLASYAANVVDMRVG